MRKGILVLVIFSFLVFDGLGQIIFQKTYGGSGSDWGNSVVQADDGGYVICGWTTSFGAGNSDVYVVKTNLSGDTLWTRTYGGASDDAAYSIQKTIDGCYIIVGHTNSFGAGGYDVYLLKINSLGDTLWTRTYGGINNDYGNSVEQTTDTGYIISGQTQSYGDGASDVYLIKTDSIGLIKWTKTFGGTGNEYGNTVHQTTDGGYIVDGSTLSFGLAGSFDNYLVKTDSNGALLWSRVFGGNGDENAGSVLQTNDGNYLLAGITNSFGSGSDDMYLIKTDSVGDTLWTKTYGGINNDEGYSSHITFDGGYIIVGSTTTFGAGASDMYLIKTNSNGDTLWTRTFGGTGLDVGYSVKQTTDSGFIILGITNSFGAGNYDMYLIKTDANGNTDCKQGTTNTLTINPATIVSNPVTIVNSGGVVNSTATINGNGGIVSNPCTSGIDEISDKYSVSIYPNPFSSKAILSIQGAERRLIVSLQIYNVLGQEVKFIYFDSQKEVTINRDQLPSGMYFYKLISTNNETLGTGKILIIENR